MSWIEKLYKTYENCESEVGLEKRDEKRHISYVLLPICHTSQNAQIEITLDERGVFRRASVIPKNGSQQTILPATEGSAGRSGSKLAPLSLGDKLQYIAGDYVDFGGIKKPGFEKYCNRLERWVKSTDFTPEIHAVLNYVQQQKIISDLIDYKILCYNQELKTFPSKWEGGKEDKPEIFSVLQGDQLDCLVRFSVEIPGQNEPRLWKNRNVWNSWIKYYLSNKILEDNHDIEKKNDHHSDDKTVCRVNIYPIAV